MADAKVPTKIVKRGIVESFRCASDARLMPRAPRIAGMESKNENLPATSRSIPKNKAVEIVAPEREIPGKIASP